MSVEEKGSDVTVEAYRDALGPASKEFGVQLAPAGKELGQTAARIIHMLLALPRATAWGYERFEKWIAPLAERLSGRDAKLVPPHPIVAGPALEALRFAGDEPTLREMYLNLLATAMDRDTVLKAHPRFVEIIRQITPDEAKIVEQLSIRGKYNRLSCYPDDKVDLGSKAREYVIEDTTLLAFQAGCQHPKLGQIYVENLTSLGLLDTPSGVGTVYYHPGEGMPEDRTDAAEMAAWFLRGGGEPWTMAQSGGWLKLSSLGQRFIEACVRPQATPSEDRWLFTWD